MTSVAKDNKTMTKYIWIIVALIMVMIGQFGPLWSPV